MTKHYAEVLAELVDGAIEIVETWEARYPAQKDWKREWLRKAKRILTENYYGKERR